MPTRIIFDLKTGQSQEVELTPEEVSAANERFEAEERLQPIKAILSIEQANPITHRALRELILTIGEIYPAGKNTVFYQRVLAAEQAIQVERAKL